MNEERLTRKPIPKNASELSERELGAGRTWTFMGDLPPPLVAPGVIFWFRYKGEFIGEFEVTQPLADRTMTYKRVREYPIVRVRYLNKGPGYKYLDKNEIDRLRKDSIGPGPYVETGQVEAKGYRRIGQGDVRNSALRRYRNKCALCKVDEPRLLIAGHIKPWATGNPRDRGIASNVILLCALHDSIFGNGFITLDPSTLEVIYSPRLPRRTRQFVKGITRKTISRPLEDSPLPRYLRWHGRHFGFKNGNKK